MSTSTPVTGPAPAPVIRRHWPAPDSRPLDDAALVAEYGRPGPAHLRVNFVTSLDGAVSLDGYSAGLSGPADKRIFGILRMLCDALLVAAGTLRHEGYRALRLDPHRRAWRRAHGLSEYPTLVIVSGSLALDADSPVFTDAPVRPLVLTHADAAPPTRLTAVADVLPCGTDQVDLAAGLDTLRQRGLRHILCEGGPQLFGTLTAADLVDELCLTVSPLLAGPGADRISTGTPSPPRRLALRQVLGADDGTLMLRYTRPD